MSVRADAFCAPAHLNIILLPVGPIRREAWQRWVERMEQFREVKGADVPGSTPFHPPPLSPHPHTIHLSFHTAPLPASVTSLAALSPAYLPHAIIGILDCPSHPSLAAGAAAFQSTLARLPDVQRARVERCWAFEPCEGEDQAGPAPGAEDVVVVEDTGFYLSTLVADVIASILAGFHSMAATIEYLPSITTPSLGLIPPYLLANSSAIHHRLPSNAISASASPPSSLPRSTSAGVLSAPSLARTPSGLGAQANLFSRSASPRSDTPPPGTGQRRKKIDGRQSKLFGDLYLLAGRLNDAISSYNDALPQLRTPADALWLGAATENLAIAQVLQYWHQTEEPPPPLPADKSHPAREPWSPLADKLASALVLYAKAFPLPSPFDRPTSSLASLANGGVPEAFTRFDLTAPLIYTRAVLRFARFLLTIWGCAGLTPDCLNLLVRGGVPSIFTSSPSPSPARLLAHGTRIPLLSRATITEVASQAHGPFILFFDPTEQLRVFSALAAIHAQLGFRRREAFFLREVEARELDLVVLTRNSGRGTNGVVAGESTHGSEDLLAVLESVCDVYGIDLRGPGLLIEGEESAAFPRDLPRQGDHFGWPALQVALLRDAIAVSEALPDYPSIIRFSLILLRTLHAHLSPAEQYHLSLIAARALVAARQSAGADTGTDKKLELDFWAPDPVVSLEVVLLSPDRVPHENALTSEEVDVPTAARQGLYRTKTRASSSAKSVAAQNEPIEFVVTLQNPFGFDLELQSIELSTSGVPFDAEPTSVSIPAASLHSIALRGVATEPGMLVVRGCKVRMADTREHEILLPLSTADEQKRKDKARNARLELEGRVKFVGLDARPSLARERPLSAALAKVAPPAQPTFLEINIVPEQPLLRIRSTSLATHGALMLYDGELSVVEVELENVSSLPVDFVSLSFEDSWAAAAQLALAEGNLCAAEAYELESDLADRPVFAWTPPTEPVSIPPDGTYTLNVQCIGKVGCTSGSININYGHLDRASPPSPLFHTRRLAFPLLVTVHTNLECHAIDLLRLDTPSSSSPTSPSFHSSEHSPPADWTNDQCLFTADVRNRFGQPFEVTFELSADAVLDASAFDHCTTRLVPPGATARVALPLPRLRLPDAETTQPIPSRSDRQYVVSQSAASGSDERTSRELFWYREALSKSIRATWKEPGTNRRGSLSLRGQRLTKSMLEVFQRDPLDVRLSVEGTLGNAVRHRKGDTWRTTVNEFADVVVSVHNYYIERDLLLQVRLEPVPRDPYDLSWTAPPIPASTPLPATSAAAWSQTANLAVFDGLLSRVLPSALAPNEHATVRFPFAPVAEGRVAFRAVVEEIEGKAARVRRRALAGKKKWKGGIEEAMQEAPPERVVQFAQRPLVVEVVGAAEDLPT